MPRARAPAERRGVPRSFDELGGSCFERRACSSAASVRHAAGLRGPNQPRSSCAASPTSSVTLALAPGESSPSALSVTYSCSGDDQRASLDVWNEARIADWRSARALSLRVKPDAELVLSVSFMDGNHTGYTQQTEPLAPAAWQVVTLPINKFWLNPYGPPGDRPGAAMDVSHVSAFGFAPRGCGSGHFLIDDFELVR